MNLTPPPIIVVVVVVIVAVTGILDKLSTGYNSGIV